MRILVFVLLQFSTVLWSAEPLYRITVGGKIGFIRSNGTVAIQPAYDPGTSHFRDGAASAVKGTQFGVLSASGQFKATVQAVQPQGEFVGGVAAAVQWSQNPGGERYGLVDMAGALVVPCSYERLTGGEEGLWSARKQNNGKFGVIRTNGAVAVPFQFDLVGKFQDGLAPVSEARKWGYINASGAKVIPTQYRQAREFSNGRAIVTSDDGQFVIDESGAKLFDVQDEQFWSYRDGMAAVKREQKMGFRDPAGTLVVPTQYDQVGDFSEGLAAVRQGMQWGFIDKSGKVIIPPDFKVPATMQNMPAGRRIIPPMFVDGLARIDADAGSGYINKSGQWIWKPSK